jgi:uncharacterized protein YaaR (DUF327 family)
MELNPVSAREQRRLDQKKAGRTHTATGTSFESTVQDIAAAETDQSVEALMNDLKDQERRFVDAQSQYELSKYKQLLQKIMKLLTSTNSEAEKLRRARRGNVQREPFLIIKQINAKVDELARTLVSSENKAFALMRTLEEIRGLIFDLKY